MKDYEPSTSSRISQTSRVSHISQGDAISMASPSEVDSQVDYDSWYRSCDTYFDFADPNDIFAHAGTQHFELQQNTADAPRSDRPWVIDVK